jgi:hypothetical protein
LVEKPLNNPGAWERPFMRNIPLDPWDHEYHYVCPGTHNVDSYDLCSFGPDGKSGGSDDFTNWGEMPAPRVFAHYAAPPRVVYEFIGILLLTSAYVYVRRHDRSISAPRKEQTP